MIFTLALAGFAIRVNSLYDEVYKLCADYLAPDAEAALEITVTPADIAAEREKSMRQDMAEGRVPVIYPDPYLETLAVYRRIAETMPKRGVFLLHGSAVALDGRAWIFTAPSGVGKTTHTKLWLEHIAGSFVVNGDKPLICCHGGGFEVCGTPWAGKEGWNLNTSVPLKGVVFLQRGEENQIEAVPASGVLPQLLTQTYRPADTEAQRETLRLLQALCRDVPFYRLFCNTQPEAALTAFACLGAAEAAQGGTAVS